MLCSDNTKVEFESQGYKTTHLGLSPDKTKSVLFFESKKMKEEMYELFQFTDKDEAKKRLTE